MKASRDKTLISVRGQQENHPRWTREPMTGLVDGVCMLEEKPQNYDDERKQGKKGIIDTVANMKARVTA